MFRFGTLVSPKNYPHIRKQTRIVRNLCYEPNLKKYNLDLVLPASESESFPVIFWLHGGAYIGGDKTDVEPYAVLIAARGFAVVNMNYPLAPEVPYPGGTMSIAKAYEFVKHCAEEYHLDMERVYFAGDSAGAQMAAQFVTAQADSFYAQETGIPRIVPYETICGVVLFCGLYDASSYAAKFDSHSPVSYLVKRVFWGVLGSKNWRYGAALEESSVLRHIPAAFPPVFLTDGNAESFTGQCAAYAEALHNCGVRVEAVLYSRKQARLRHEYQFNLRKKEARATLDRLFIFLNDTMNPF